MSESSTTVETRAPIELGAAIIEVVERHTDAEKRPTLGTASIICPNLLRINGVAMWATYDDPVAVREVQLGGEPGTPFAVTVKLFARTLAFGAEPSYDAAAEDANAGMNAGAVVEIPDLEEFTAGDLVERPYVLLNGRALYVQGPVVVGEMVAGGKVELSVATVTLTLLCRRFLVDDEACPPRELNPVEPAVPVPAPDEPSSLFRG